MGAGYSFQNNVDHLHIPTPQGSQCANTQRERTQRERTCLIKGTGSAQVVLFYSLFSLVDQLQVWPSVERLECGQGRKKW